MVHEFRFVRLRQAAMDCERNLATPCGATEREFEIGKLLGTPASVGQRIGVASRSIGDLDAFLVD